MKTPFMIALLLLSMNLVAQDMSQFLTDSMIPGLKVKTRTRAIQDKIPHPYVVDHYLTDGKLSWTETRAAGSGSLLIGTRYYYDSIGQLDSSVLTNFGVHAEKVERSLVINAERKKIRKMITTYRYEKGRKIESTSADEKGRTCFQTRYDSSGYKTNWYNDSGRVFRITKLDLKAGAIPLEAFEIEVDEDGDTTVAKKTAYSNVYNKKGQLSKSFYQSESCKSRRKYAYFRNGLIKSMHGDKCGSNWSFTYTYY